MNIKINAIRNELTKKAGNSLGEGIARFFKTTPGSYAAHDQFIGIKVPIIRSIARQYKDLDFNDIKELLDSCFNEERLLALIILTTQYEKGNQSIKNAIYEFYQNNINQINNWNLVDASAHLIIGAHLYNKDKNYLITLSQSTNLWHRRMAVIATLYFIRKNDLDWTFKIAKLLLHDTHDLIHKAVGWMLREAGKKNESSLIAFLEKYARIMPRTMLAYAIEKLPQDKQIHYRLLRRKQ